MARIAGVDLPRDKRVAIGLTYIFGIGHATANRIASQARIDSQTRISELSEDQVSSLRSIIEVSHKVEGSLRGETTMNVKRLMDIGCYRGLRHRRGLPANGQRTKTNARTRKGPRRAIAGKKKAPVK
ncbi:MAG: 30S ribosomal protein S13 [Gemmatimonadetes bacterium]|nr:30S ribosomal protein S13 [Gemmatimonadota bacterium]